MTRRESSSLVNTSSDLLHERPEFGLQECICQSSITLNCEVKSKQLYKVYTTYYPIWSMRCWTESMFDDQLFVSFYFYSNGFNRYMKIDENINGSIGRTWEFKSGFVESETQYDDSMNTEFKQVPLLMELLIQAWSAWFDMKYPRLGTKKQWCPVLCIWLDHPLCQEYCYTFLLVYIQEYNCKISWSSSATCIEHTTTKNEYNNEKVTTSIYILWVHMWPFYRLNKTAIQSPDKLHKNIPFSFNSSHQLSSRSVLDDHSKHR